MERERDGRRGGNDRHKEMETDPEMETDTQRKWGRRMRERRRGKGRREGKTKRDGAEMVSQTDRGRKTQNETEGEAQTRETQRVGRRQPSEGKRGAGETWRQVSKQGRQKWERQVQKMERNWVRRGGQELSRRSPWNAGGEVGQGHSPVEGRGEGRSHLRGYILGSGVPTFYILGRGHSAGWPHHGQEAPCLAAREGTALGQG